MIKKYLEEAVQLELNISKLYLKFSNICNDDYTFWYTLSIEEGGHAAILKNILSSLNLINYNFNITDIDIQEIELANDYIISILNKNLNRNDAFNIALNLENSSGEIHYQKLIDNDNIDDIIVKTFIKLNGEDEKHVFRINEYMIINNIK